MSSGIKSELIVQGDHANGLIFNVKCRFTLPVSSPRVLEFDSLFRAQKRSGNETSSSYRERFVDTVVFYGDSNVIIQSNPIWTGKIIPGRQYELAASVALRKPVQSSLYVRCTNRYGRDMLGVKKFYYGIKNAPIGFVTDTLRDSLGNVTHKHHWVTDSTQRGFVRYSGKALPPDTTFDSHGKIIFILQRANPDSLPNKGQRLIPKLSSPSSSMNLPAIRHDHSSEPDTESSFDKNGKVLGVVQKIEDLRSLPFSRPMPKVKGQLPEWLKRQAPEGRYTKSVM